MIRLFIGLGLCCFMNASAQSWWDKTPLEVREMINSRIFNTEAPASPVWATENRIVKNEGRSTPIRIYLPNQKKGLPLILLIHGGAWVAGNLDTHDNLARYLCSQVEAVVISIGYTNAPEGKFPVPVQQCFDVLTWAKKHASEISADPSRLAVVGDSAGGNLAAALCLMTRDVKGPKIKAQVLINPALDLRCNGTLERQNDSLDIMRWQAEQYLSDAADANHPYVSPLAAKDLQGLPKTLILVAEKDDLRPDGEKYAQRLQDADIPTILFCQQGIGHLAAHGARASSQAKESLDVAVQFLKSAL